MRFTVALLAISVLAVLGCVAETDDLPSPSPTPVYVTIYVTVTPSPTPIPTRTSLPTPTHTPTATPFPELKDPSLSSIWGDVELFSLLYAIKDRPIATQQKYDGQRVVIRQRFGYFGVNPNEVTLSGSYAHNEPIERRLIVTCNIPDVQDRHLPILAELMYLHEHHEFDLHKYVHVEGIIERMRLSNGGLTLFVSLSDCDITAIGNRIVG